MATSDAAGFKELLHEYKKYLALEKGLSANSVEAYLRDAEQFCRFIGEEFGIAPPQAEPHHIEAFMAHVYDRRAKKSSQARILSGVKSLFYYLAITERIEELPTELIDAPKPGRTLPEVLTVGEIDAILASIDVSQPLGHRNRAMIEVLYSCGLRVSELVTLRLSDLFFDEGYIRVTGKGDKQRLVPVSDAARREVEIYLGQRDTMKVSPRSREIVFLNQRGAGLTRVMVFTILRRAAQAAGITKHISPHTLRHSFATHLLAGGAGIRQVQEMLGHESITTTEIYTHLDTSSLADTLNQSHPLGNRGLK